MAAANGGAARKAGSNIAHNEGADDTILFPPGPRGAGGRGRRRKEKVAVAREGEDAETGRVDDIAGVSAYAPELDYDNNDAATAASGSVGSSRRGNP